MSNYNSLKTTIDANIKQNGRQEITGQILNSVLNQMVTTLGAGYQFAGVATIDTNPGAPDAKVFYIANGKGTYTNFSGIEVTEDDVVVLYWDSSWHKVSTGIASQAKLSELNKQIVYDVTANNGGVKFNSISALLSSENLSTLIPDGMRCGGMSIRFVQSSDNKYVQFRCMANSFTTDVTQWQGVDEEPIYESESTVKSGGVYDRFDNLNKKLYSDEYTILSTLTINNSIQNWFLNSSGAKEWGGSDFYIHVYAVQKNKTYRVVSYMQGSSPSMCLMSDANCNNLIKVIYTGNNRHISIFTAPEDCYLAYSYYNGYDEEVNEINYSDFILDDIKNATKYISKVSNIYISPSSTQTGKYIDPDYALLRDNQDFNVVIYNIESYKGEIRIPVAYAKGASYLGYIFKRNGVTIEYGSYSGKDTFTIPNNADEFWFSANANVTYTDINILTEEPINEVVKKLDKGTLYNGLFVNKAASLTTGEQLPLTNVPDLHNYHLMSFYANIETMGRIRLQHGNSAYAIGAIEVDDTNVYCYNNANGTDVIKTVPHEVDIKKFIFIQVDYKNDYPNLLVRISSNGSAFKEIQINNAYWNGGNGVTFAKSILGTFTNANVSFGGRSWFYDTWVFTDSYGDYWPKYLTRAGIDKFMLDGVSGRDSENAYASFELDLMVTTPKVVLWCLGMNDPDGSSAINQNYKTYLDKLVEKCKEYNIKLVVTTIPNTPTQNHTYKNEYIKSIGVDYIDVAKAVGGDTMGSSWTTGYLSTDNIHPTELGAMVIANAIVTGLPSIQ